jgi:Domain of unknown function (DUF4397)
MIRRLFSVAVLVGILASGCSKSDNTPASTTNVMFVNGCIPSTSLAFNVDGTVNGSAVSGATGIALLHNSGYKQVATGADSISFVSSGAVVLGKSTTTAANTSYSVFLGGSGFAPAFILTTDDLTAPASGNIKIRYANLSPQNLNESCYYGNTKLDSNVAYLTVTPFFQVSAATANILMQDPANPTVFPTNLQNQVFTAGKIYTVMLTGLSTSSGSSALTYTLINNN